MASITIRRLDERLKTQLKHRAAQHGCSMEEEARNILRESLGRDRPKNAADIALELFGPKRGFKLDLPSRESFRPPPDFSKE
ncbi:MAG TPA: plasmid stabilization protein [Stellaceae bacterium]|nr:plasmid stabilization protein [Stellaceae bacterium]